MIKNPDRIDYCMNILFGCCLLLISLGGLYYLLMNGMQSFSIIQYSETNNINTESLTDLRLIKVGVIALIGLQFIKLITLGIQYICKKEWIFLAAVLILLGVLSYSNLRFYFH
jgi:hypothetical protein